jgi:hypothetical protein
MADAGDPMRRQSGRIVYVPPRVCQGDACPDGTCDDPRAMFVEMPRPVGGFGFGGIGNPRGREKTGEEAAQTANPAQTTPARVYSFHYQAPGRDPFPCKISKMNFLEIHADKIYGDCSN